MAAALSLAVLIGAPAAQADEEFARTRVKEMSDYLAAQAAFSFDYDSTLEVVSTDDQKLQLVSSGAAIVNRPDRIRARRHGGFVDVELVFDGKVLTIVGHTANKLDEFTARHFNIRLPEARTNKLLNSSLAVIQR